MFMEAAILTAAIIIVLLWVSKFKMSGLIVNINYNNIGGISIKNDPFNTFILRTLRQISVYSAQNEVLKGSLLMLMPPILL